ncbi:MAG TPA: hybrid sensor histidine kinase/response regulator [Anaerolineae bacterium]|nr:hybrid sensor histidine kinase/response regulator [Anaerolineae bacterium]
MDLSFLIPDFLAEVREHLAVLEGGLLNLEAAPDADSRAQAVNTLFRSAHTVKGSSRLMGYHEVGRVAHALEDVLGELRSGRLTTQPTLVDRLLRAVDQLRRMIDQPPDDIEGGETTVTQLRDLLPAEEPASETFGFQTTSAALETDFPLAGLVEEGSVSASDTPAVTSASPTPAPHAEPLATVSDDTVRVAVSRLDELLRLTGELMLGVQRTQALERADQQLTASLRSYLEPGVRQPANSLFAADPQARRSTPSQPAVRALIEQTNTQQLEFADAIRFLAATVEQLEQEVMTLRLLPVSGAFAGMSRLVRDLAREHDKQVELSIEGETTEIDRRILQGLGEPLMHLIRNAVDHGLESPAARVQAGKSPIGQISVRAYRQSSRVKIEVADDGRGLSPPALREAAVRKHLLSADEAAALADAAALDLIYLPGFSTTTFVTSTSGRGVGLEVVKTAIAKLGGSIEIATQPGAGTCFSLALPLTLTLARVLFVTLNATVYALPVAAIERIVRLTPELIQPALGREHLSFENKAIPILRLSRLLAGAADDSSAAFALIISIADQRTAFIVGDIIDEREAVLKPLGELLSQAEIASGATLLPDGQVAIVLDPAACLRAARTPTRRAVTQATQTADLARPRRRILLVEDTHTTRELERTILVASGYEVDPAADGAEGWRKAQANAYDLIVTDVEMPNMTGFELAAALRAEARFAAVPIVIVTSLEHEREKRQGLNVGAQAYLVKSAFDQTALLETIERLLP